MAQIGTPLREIEVTPISVPAPMEAPSTPSVEPAVPAMPSTPEREKEPVPA